MLMKEKYSSSIKFDGPGDARGHFLDIKITFGHRVTQEEYDSNMDFYQMRFSQKTGKQVPREEISVTPKVGELIESELHFEARLGRPLYDGIKDVHQKAPYVLPKLIEDLNNQKKELREVDRRLVLHVVNGLIDIVES